MQITVLKCPLILLLLVGGLGFWLGITIRIEKNGRETAIEVPEGSTTRIDADGNMNVKLPDETNHTSPASSQEEETPYDIWLKRRIAEVSGELAAQKALLERVDDRKIPAAELEDMVAFDPLAKQLAQELAFLKMDRSQIDQATDGDAKKGPTKRHHKEVDRLQKQYDQRLDELRKKVRENDRSEIEKEIVKLTAQLASLREQRQVGPKAAVNPAAELKALLGKWTVTDIKKGKDGDSTWEAICPARGHYATVMGMAGGMEGGATVESGKVPRSDPTYLARIEFGSPIQEMLKLDPFHKMIAYRINTLASPETIDLLYLVNGSYKPIALGIYEIEKDRLKIRLTKPLPAVVSDQRPKNFDIDPDSADILFELDRYRPTDDDKAVEGKWSVESRTDDGKSVSAAMLREGTCYFSKGSLSVWFEEGKNQSLRIAGPFLLDLTKRPKTISIVSRVFKDHRDTFVKILGIYKIDGDRLTIAYRKGDTPPEKFESQPGSGVTLLELRRAK